MSIDAYLSEYQALREEILSRTQLGNALVTIELTAIGIGVATFHSAPEVLIGLAIASSLLWLLWIDHASQVWKIAMYISRHLAPLVEASAPNALKWEDFLRQFDYQRPGQRSRFLGAKTRSISTYMTLIFGVAGPLLLVGYCLVNKNWSGSEGAFRIIAVVAGSSLFVFAALQYRAFLLSVRGIDQDILGKPKDTP